MCEQVGFAADGLRCNTGLQRGRAAPRSGLAARPGRDAGLHPPPHGVAGGAGGGGMGGRAPSRARGSRGAGRSRTGARHLLVAARPRRDGGGRGGHRRTTGPAGPCRGAGGRGGRRRRRRSAAREPDPAFPSPSANSDHGHRRARPARRRAHRRPGGPSRRCARRPALPPRDPGGNLRPLSLADRARRHQPALDGPRRRRSAAGGSRGADRKPWAPEGGNGALGPLGGGAGRDRVARHRSRRE